MGFRPSQSNQNFAMLERNHEGKIFTAGKVGIRGFTRWDLDALGLRKRKGIGYIRGAYRWYYGYRGVS